MKRQIFLKSFLGALGAVEILWTDIQIDKIYGTVIYDISDPEERQDFVCYMTENNVPNDDVKMLIDFLSKNELIDIDKIITPINELEIDFIDKSKLDNVWNDLFNIEVHMIDDGVESKQSDKYFIHD
ncbi:hypothetical protein [Parasediminibacterium sp. JCM 36343]|uniref:hypothetical protein n=1 Tax=Parasediminibacterium sp. JCM 36343 TaxID=3374279 RepID=UPI00397A9212